MAQFGDTIRCDGCGVEITLSPWVRDTLQYCCQDCADGLECECGTVVEMEEYDMQSANSLELTYF